MDDQAVIRTYGNTNLPEGTEDRPLVTFALFAYNQEKYIREAVEGAFSQTYSPLEIILSDDCSSDRTFEIMEEMAREYNGPHLVKVRRGKINIGTLAHVLTVASFARGQLFVVAAGDDISFPERTATMQSHFSNVTDDVVVSSSDDIIFDDRDGFKGLSSADAEIRDRLYAEKPVWFLGATACYRLLALNTLPIPQYPVLNEDEAISAVFSGLKFRSSRISVPLIHRRMHDLNTGSIRRGSVDNTWTKELQTLRSMRNAVSAFEYAAHTLEFLRADSSIAIKKADFFRAYSCWYEIGFFELVRLMPLSVALGYGLSLGSRLFGKRMFLGLKRLQGIVSAF